MLAPKIIGNGNTVTKKDLVIVQPYLGELSLEIRTGTNRRIKNNAPECALRLFSRLSGNLVNVLHLKTEFHRSYILTLVMNLKLNALLRVECVKPLEFRHSVGKQLKAMTILPLKSTFYSAIVYLV